MKFLLKGKVKRGGKASYGRLLRKRLKKDGWEETELSGVFKLRPKKLG